MPALKPAYLIHGDDHGRIGERRARLRRLADQSGGPLESASSPEEAAALLATLTLATGWRVIVVDGCERWREEDVRTHLEALATAIPPETTIAFFALEDGRLKAPALLHELVKRAGGDVAGEAAVKEWDLPKWVIARGAEKGLTLDMAAARALVQATGPRQARLDRELEKLATELGPGARVSDDTVTERIVRAAERKVWTLADALVARDRRSAVRLYLELRDQGERVESLGYWMTRRLREALAVAQALETGTPVAKVRAGLRMPPRPAAKFIEDVGRTDSAALRRAIALLAQLELDTRGHSALDPDTLAVRTIERIAA
jgi:DNA polymerase-3 subunit delta